MRCSSVSGFTIEVPAPGRLFFRVWLFGRFLFGEAPPFFLVALEALVVIQVRDDADDCRCVLPERSVDLNAAKDRF